MTQKPCGIALTFPASAPDARRALETIMNRLRDFGLAEEQSGAVEIALAETVNNIVEHAYADLAAGRIQVRGSFNRQTLTLQIVDQGKPLPGGQLPDGRLARNPDSLAELPEGGFGWFLIRTLVRDIRYQRKNGENHLQLTFDLVPPAV